MQLVMFDIDGTLVDSTGFDSMLYAEAVATRVEERFVALVRRHIERAPQTVREVAGARRLVDRLLALPNVRVAIATGGWERTARLKLAHVGIPASAAAFASGSDAEARTDIMRLAAQRAADRAPFERTVYFGDGSWDLRACRALGYDFVAVGTAVSHPVAWPDLSDADAILTRVGLMRSAGV